MTQQAVKEVLVGSFETPLEAELAALMLRSYGLQARLVDAVLVAAALPLSSMLGGVKLVVPEFEAESASALLAEHRRSDKHASGIREIPEPTAAGDERAVRAFRISLVALLLVPVLFNAYSEYVLLQIRGAPLSPRGIRHRRWAHILNGLVFACAAFMLLAWFERLGRG